MTLTEIEELCSEVISQLRIPMQRWIDLYASTASLLTYHCT